ncbi:MAG: Translation initiation factor 3 subunit J component [Lichina confinis]|nr:MAG: Translation initiation factor 3 subunit J component [Lichina confinis]
MAPAMSRWDDEEDSTPPSSPPVVATLARRSKFDDEEGEADIVESWDAEDDSDVEVEKARVAAERKAKAEAEAAANKKSKTQRRAEHQAVRKARQELDEDTSSEETEDEQSKRERLRKTEQDADLKHAEDLFGNIGVADKRPAPKTLVMAVQDPKSANEPSSVDLASLPIFSPKTKDDFTRLSQLLVPLITKNSRHPQYTLHFLADFVRQISRDLPSAEIKKLSSAVALQLNEKIREEKTADKAGKKTKAAKTKASLVANRDTSYRADVTSYDDGLEE